MSFLFLLFYWVALPLIIVFAVVALLRLNIGRFVQGIIITVGIGAASWLLWIAVGETWMLDRQVRELCAKDGGIKVYETVPLPPELEDGYGGIRLPTKEKLKRTDKFYYTRERIYVRDRNPVIWMSISRIYRKIDNKLLGKSVSYTRRGGGVPGPWHESSFRCPKKQGLERNIFIKEKIK